jgi:hypothetical protein
MGDKGECQLPRTLTEQKGNHHAPARVVPIAFGSGVDQDPMTARGAKQCAVSLPHIEKM